MSEGATPSKRTRAVIKTRSGEKPDSGRIAGRSESKPKPDSAAGGDQMRDQMGGLIRVSRLLSEQGLCSRREADRYIERGWVFVDGQRITELGTRAHASARVTLAPEAARQEERLVTLLIHKPVGFVSGQPEAGYRAAVSLINAESEWRANTRRSSGHSHARSPVRFFNTAHLRGLAPAGRLDIDSTGLLVLTQDGRIAKKLIGEDSTMEKEYLVRVQGRLCPNGLELLRHGLSLDDKPLKPARVEWQNDDQLRFILTEGKKRQIRRMCEQVGLAVTGLKRVRIGNVCLGDLPPGRWRYLRGDERF